MVSESIIVGLVIGVGVSVVGTLVSHFVRKREMDRLWTEEERRRKSDRRRELYERDLRIVSDAVDAVMEAMAKVGSLAYLYDEEEGAEAMTQAILMMEKVNVVTLSLKDQELRKRYVKLLEGWRDWLSLLDWHRGRAKEGKQDEFKELTGEMDLAASEVWRRIGKILEEV